VGDLSLLCHPRTNRSSLCIGVRAQVLLPNPRCATNVVFLPLLYIKPPSTLDTCSNSPLPENYHHSTCSTLAFNFVSPDERKFCGWTLELKCFSMYRMSKWVELCCKSPIITEVILLNLLVKGTSNVLQLGVSIATAIPANQLLSSTIIVFIYCVVFVLNIICFILEYSLTMKSQRREATPALGVSA